jgi:hypothetical protein
MNFQQTATGQGGWQVLTEPLGKGRAKIILDVPDKTRLNKAGFRLENRMFSAGFSVKANNIARLFVLSVIVKKFQKVVKR